MLRYGIVINSNSGSVTEKLRQEFLASLQLSKLDYLVEFVAGKDMITVAENLLKSGRTALVAGGGDGSLGGIADLAAQHGVPFGVLPFGTLNHFAKDLGLPTDYDGLIQMLEHENTKNIDYARLGDSVFLNNSSIGIYPELVFRREDREKKLGKWPAAAISLFEILRQPLRIDQLSVTYNNEKHEVKTPFVFVGNNDYGFDSFGVNKREELDKGLLSLCIFRGQSRRQLFWHLFRSVLGKPSIGVLDCYQTDEITIESNSGSLKVALDGEAYELKTPLSYTIQKQKLLAIIP